MHLYLLYVRTKYAVRTLAAAQKKGKRNQSHKATISSKPELFLRARVGPGDFSVRAHIPVFLT